MSDILEKIIATKHTEIAARQTQTPIAQLQEQLSEVSQPRGFTKALNEKIAAGKPAVIAEVKKASPSKGVIRVDFDPVEIAKSYAAHDAACLSVLTDEQYFQGADQYLIDARGAVNIPVLRKDFTVDEYQLVEARSLGADCILLIVAALDIMNLTVLYQKAKDLGMDVLIEVHNKTELDAAMSLRPNLIGINNRNLKTFETSLDNTLDLLDHIPDNILVVTESGIGTREDVALMRQHGVNAFLVGEAFMRKPSPGAELEALFT